jgi:hypothetical protein
MKIAAARNFYDVNMPGAPGLALFETWGDCLDLPLLQENGSAQLNEWNAHQQKLPETTGFPQ